MAKPIIKSRFAGVTLVDRGVEAGQRWWPVMTGIYTAGLTGYAKASTLFAGFSWLDAAVFGFAGALGLTFLTLGSFAAYRHLRPRPLPTQDREEFRDEIISLADLVGDQEPLVAHKKFIRCIIQGPGQIRFRRGVTYLLCSAPSDQIVERPEGANMAGSVAFFNVTFDRCHFHNLALVSTPKDAEGLRHDIEPFTLSQWKERRWKTI